MGYVDGVPDESGGSSAVGYRPVAAAAAAAANRRWWDGDADAYLAEHGRFLGGDQPGEVRFVWGPEGLDEADVGLLGDVAGRRVLEVGCGAAQCGRWLVERGAAVVGVDLSIGMLGHAHRLDAAVSQRGGRRVDLVCADARRLSLASECVDLACSAYGALPFVTDPGRVHAEVARVLRPGGRWVFSVTHPVRWAFPDDPGPAGLVVARSYFDRTPYVETGADGEPAYVEQHRTLGDRVREVVGAGLRLLDVVEPEWPDGHDQVWGGWSPRRGRLIPGTAIFVTAKPG